MPTEEELTTESLSVDIAMVVQQHKPARAIEALLSVLGTLVGTSCTDLDGGLNVVQEGLSQHAKRSRQIFDQEKTPAIENVGGGVSSSA